MTHRLLLVEQSAAMRDVLEKHAQSLGYVVDACESYPQAAASLAQQFQQFGSEYSGLLFGWPTAAQEDASEFAQLLENTDHKDLPVVVMSADQRAETRAWVAGRDNTAMLAWKGYQGLEEALQKLIDVAEVQADRPDDETVAVKFDNRDVNLLIVDDSATIRYSLRDLFQTHGYSVTLAASRDEAMAHATQKAHDIAVLDYYLTETTGDVLCKELLASKLTGDIVCTVLTGTYSDHIIKRSLRSGAVECMFKNESSELLLSRIDAISRFVRQRRLLQREQKLLEDVLECIAGALVLLNDEKHIVYLNTLALAQLGIAEKSTLIGEPAHHLLETDGPATPGPQLHAATWRLPDGNPVEVDYQHSHIDSCGYSLLRFAQRSVPIADTGLAVLQQNTDPDMIVSNAQSRLGLAPQSEPFLHQMLSYLSATPGNAASTDLNDASDSNGMRISLLVLDVYLRQSDGELVSIADDPALAMRVQQTLEGMNARENHIVALNDNRYGFLLRHGEEAHAYMLTRKVMQRCIEVQPKGELPAISCMASLLSLTKNSSQPLNVLIQHAFKGMELAKGREPDQAILLDVRRLLSAYPIAASPQ